MLIDLVAHLPIGVFRQHNRARLADSFEPSRDVDPVAHQVAVGFLDDVPQVNPNADLDAVVVSQAGVALS